MGNLFRQLILINKRLSNLLLGNRQLFLCFFQFAPCIFKIVGNPFSKILDTGNRSLTGIAYIRPIQQSAPQNNIPFKRIEVHEKRKATIRTNFKLIFIFSTAFTYHPIKKGKCFARCRSLRIMLSIQHDGEILAFGLTQQRNVLRDSLNFLLIFPDAGWICQVTHLLIGHRYPAADAALESTDYLTRLDAYTFHEGFAHLLSYQATEIDCVNWHTPQLTEVAAASRAKLRLALTETDPDRQKQFLEEAVCGSYYEKFACMCGMLYLAD